MSEEELKKTIDIVASIEVNNETEAIAKEELMSYAEQLQNEHNILTEFEKWLKEQYSASFDPWFPRILNKLQELKEGKK